MKLTEEQKQFLKKNKWDLIPNESGHVWIGGDWDSKMNLMRIASDVLPLDNEASGYNFLVIAYQENKDE